MATGTTQFREQLFQLFNRLTPRQKLLIFSGLVIALAIFLVMLVWTAGPNYDVLFSNLSQKDAGKIVEKLKEKKIDYKLENGGGTILVPTDKVYDLRLEFAREGLPENSSVGYEIFDRTNLGMTDFIQQLNYRRALEGELAHTIEQIEVVERARVHIVIPKEALFKEDQKEPTASVILKLKGRSTPKPITIQAISHLVASSVEGLTPENITIVDTYGRILSDNQDPNNMMTLSATQLEFTQKVEQYLTKKVQSMLDQAVGPGNAVVRVTADLNFTQVEKNIEQYDPENPSVRSEEIEEESTPVGSTTTGNTSTPASKRSSTVTNYELNRTVEHIVQGIGNVEHISVAVMVNNKRVVETGPDGEKTVKYVPRSPEEIQTLTELVKTAVGFNPERNDQISVVNVNFSLPNMEEEIFQDQEPSLWDNWYNIIEKVFLILAIVVSFLIMKSLFTQVQKRHAEITEQIKMLEAAEMGYPELPAPEGRAREIAPGEASDSEATSGEEDEDNTVIQAKEFFKIKPQADQTITSLHEFIRSHPEEASKLLKVWLMEEDEKGAF